MNRANPAVALLILIAASIPAHAAVVINEVFYHAPNDLDDLEWIELHNTGEQPVDLSGWAFARDLRYTLPEKTTIEASGYLVIARNPDRFLQHYGSRAIGGFETPLKNGSARIELIDAKGERMDAIQYKDKAPWPLSADGYSASLERICPAAPGNGAANWAPSPLAVDRPSGTPGRRNAAWSENLPPVISQITCSSDDPAPQQPLQIEARVEDPDGLRDVTLLYRIAAPGLPESSETAVAMEKGNEPGRYVASIPGQQADRLIRYRIKAIDQSGAQRIYPAENDVRPTFSAYVHAKFEPGRIPLASIIHTLPAKDATKPAARPRGSWFFSRPAEPPSPPREPQGRCAFVYVDPKTGKVSLFDHLHITDRRTVSTGRQLGGYRVRFHKDRTFRGMTAVNILFEGNERFLLAEPLAYEVYRRAGNAAPMAEFVRLSVDGRLAGYHLVVEVPNSAFLRRNKVADGGNLYKLIWFGRGIVGQHEKKTSRHTGHEDLLKLVQALRVTDPDEQWKVIQENFNVDQVATYFAANMVLSHWDGYFNNYYTYHDISATGKWEMYPWDQDKTWGYYDGIADRDVFTTMPLSFGMQGDQPPGSRGQQSGGFFGGGFGFNGASWWRPGGCFSAPLLANPHFRKIFLARTREILDTIYTPEVFFPVIDEMADLLRDEVRIRAQANRGTPDAAVARLERNVESLKAHLTKRREFLLAQDELKSLEKVARPQPANAPAAGPQAMDAR